MFVSGWEKSNKLPISENNYISSSLRFFSAKSTCIHRSPTSLFYSCKTPHWLPSSAQCFLSWFPWVILLVIIAQTCALEQDCQCPPLQRKTSLSLSWPCVTPACHWYVSEFPAGTPEVVARAWVSLPNAGRDHVQLPGEYGDCAEMGRSCLLKMGQWLVLSSRQFLPCLNMGPMLRGL